MERQCYALIWGIMHFRQYLHGNRFTLKIDHKPLEWLAIVSNFYGKEGRWIEMLQDFDFKSYTKQELSNVDVFNRNHANPTTNDENLMNKIQDMWMLKEMGI
jgi:hypothetical protein